MNNYDPFSIREQRRFGAHMRKRAHGLMPRIFGLRWRQARAHARAFAHPHVAVTIDAYERGEIANFRDLKIITTAIASIGDHHRFENSLRLFDPALANPPAARRKRFAGTGHGGGSLDIFRELEVDGETLFEKTYLRRGRCFEQMYFMYETVLPRIEGVTFPALRAIHGGKQLCRTYFEHIGPGCMERYDIDHAAAVVGALAAVEIGDLRAPAFVKRMGKPVMERARASMIARMTQTDPEHAARVANNIRYWQERLECFPVVLAHADLNRTNFSIHGHVIDWDAAGFLPYGYDAASVAHHSGLVFGDLDALGAFYGHYFERRDATHEDWVGFLFFALHFMQLRAHEGHRAWLTRQILAALEARLGQAPADAP